MSSIAKLFDLKNRVALVTGGSSGIGFAMAQALAAAGAKLILVARREPELAAAVADLGSHGHSAMSFACDLTDRKALAECALRAPAFFGPPDILVNAAGVNIRKPLPELKEEDWDATMAINLSAPYFLAQQLAPAMVQRRWGRIINIASLQSVRAFNNSGPYGASKGGVMQLTRAMAEYWSQFGVTCNAIAPGFFNTPLTAPVFNDPARAAALAAQTMIGRNGELQDLHGITVFLASDASAYITGQTLFVDGGFSAK
jgi:NAD(P)-dependent dehydrogenase (short-subunit alcohol dehydrogenase family)